MTSPAIPTQPVQVDTQAALDALVAIPDGDPNLELSLRAIEAVAVLRLVRPPYPPIRPATSAVPAEVAVEVALGALERAIENASSVEEATRAGAAGAILRGAPVEWFL